MHVAHGCFIAFKGRLSSILTFIARFCAAVSVGFDLINHCRDQCSTNDKRELALGYSDIWVEDNPDYNQDVFQKLGIQEPLRRYWMQTW